MRPSQGRRLVALLLCISILLCVAGVNLTSVAAAKKKTGIITASSLNVRIGPGTTYDKLVVNGVNAFLKQGDTVTILKESSGWYYIKFEFYQTTVKGYVSADYVQVEDATSAEPTPEVTPTPTVTPTLTPTPTSAGAIYTKELEVDEITNEIAAAVNVSVLNLRSKASTSGTVVAKLNLGTLVTVTNELNTVNGKWYKIEVDETGDCGYVLSDYISILFDETIKSYLSVSETIYPRKSASDKGAYIKTSAGKKISLKNEKAVTVIAEKTVKDVKWFRISFKVSGVSYKGYVKADLVRFKQTVYEKEEVTDTPTLAPTEKVTPTPTPTPSNSVTPTPTPSNSVTPTPEVTITPTPTEAAKQIQGAILKNNTTATIYASPGFGQCNVADQYGGLVYIYRFKPFAVYEKVTMDGYDWYYVGAKQNDSLFYGYILADYVELDSSYDSEVSTWYSPNMEVPQVTPGISIPPSVSVTITPTPTPTSNPSNMVTSNEAFEMKLADQGFPESYKVLLRQLHEQYPLWEFEAYQTGLDWNTVIENESEVGLNLITNSKSIEWKSLATGAYKWTTDKFVPFDGSTWVTASQAAIEYYMDPRNFITANGIFQFELLSYRKSYQDVEGVENILKNTAMANREFTFTDDFGVVQTMTYAEAFIAAAEYANVSPYHLATRVKQEVVTGTNTLSNSVSGTVLGYEGLYNFYNIGAYHSTSSGGAVINALKYALTGTGNAELDALYRIPWDNPYDAIVGGAYYIGRNYINRGDEVYHSQDTIYLQKFNVTNKTTYRHQYMANVEATFAESKKMFAAVKDFTNLPLVFSIPVYVNMPSNAAPYPATQYNPNNWLKTLSVTDANGNELIMTPTFDISANCDYSLIVSAEVDLVNVSATTVSSKASVIAGTGAYTLNTGTNQLSVIVKAENGDMRAYNIYIVKP